MGRRAPLALAAVFACVAMALPLAARAHATPTAAAADPATDTLRAVQAVLDARVSAVESGDRAGWLATVDPAAAEAFRSAQGQSFDGLRSLPLASFGLVARLTDSGDLSAGLGSRYGATAFLPETRQTMRLRDFDAVDAVDSLWLTFVQRDGRWYVASDSDLAAVGLDSFKGLWDLGPVATIARPNVLVLFHPAQRDRAEALADITQEAVGVLSTRWDRPWPGKIPVVLPASTAELDVMLQSVIDLDKFVAFTVTSSIRDDDEYRTSAPRVYAQDRNLTRYNHAGQVEILVHELAHAAAQPVSGPFIPSWVHEGVADWEARGRSTAEKRPRASDGMLPRDFEFTTGSQSSIVLAYDESRSLMAVAAARFGLGAPTAILATIGSVKLAPGSTDYQVDQAVRKVTNASLTDLQTAWAG